MEQKETKKSVVEQAAVALRLWSNAWNEFDKTGKNKPETFEEVIKPFIEMEKEQRGYSEEEVRLAYFQGEKDSYVKGGQTKEMENEFIQSLKQKHELNKSE